MQATKNRLRKYARKKRLAFASRNPKLMDYLTLYWRYHHKVCGPPKPLWKEPHEH